MSEIYIWSILNKIRDLVFDINEDEIVGIVHDHLISIFVNEHIDKKHLDELEKIHYVLSCILKEKTKIKIYDLYDKRKDEKESNKKRKIAHEEVIESIKKEIDSGYWN